MEKILKMEKLQDMRNQEMIREDWIRPLRPSLRGLALFERGDCFVHSIFSPALY